MQANLAAVRALVAQQAAGRSPTEDDLTCYRRFCGWGAVPRLFDERDAVQEIFAGQRAELRSLLGEERYRAARAATLNAHYTDPAYAAAIWEVVAALGFDGGRVLEPGCGAGGFIGLAPAKARVVGVELEPTTAAIAAQLHPEASIHAESFAETRIAEASFDLVVGNVPFGNYKLHDRVHNPGRRHPVHNHFILKSLRATKPGGFVALITSRYTMDGQDAAHQQARAEMNKLADLAGAVRLPAGAHEAAAGTQVVTDLLILRRRRDHDKPSGPAWQQAHPVELPAVGDGGPAASIPVNEYFLQRPEQVLGRMLTETGRRGAELTVAADEPVAPALTAALRRLTDRQPSPVDGPPPLQEGLYQALRDGTFTQIRNGAPVEHHPPRTQAAELRALIGLRDTVLALLDEEASQRGETTRMGQLRHQLNRSYDHYAARYGTINRYKLRTSTRVDQSTGGPVEREHRTYPQMGGFRDDPFWPYVMALEDFDEQTQQAQKADLLSHRVVAPPAPRDRADGPEDALLICWDAHHEVRLDEIARLLGLPGEPEARQALGTLVYDEPGTDRLVRKAEYLSGNVRRKLAAAEEAADGDPRFAVNVEALRQVVPRDLTPGEIEARLGSPWIEARYVQQFLREMLEDDTISVSNLAAQWSVSGGHKSGVLARTVWGTDKRNALELASNLLNSQPIVVTSTFKRDGHMVSVIDSEGTAIAQAKGQQLDERFRRWLWEEPGRASELARTYNDRFNALVPQSFDGELVTAPGMSRAFTLYPHQMAAVARIRATPGVGLFHGTGAGKTLEMIVGGMELVRLGLVRKPCYVVPKDVLPQFQREFLQAYPRARILAADSEDLTGEKRRRFVARCSTGSWDAVLMTHEAFKRIPVSKEVQLRFIEKEKQRLESHLANAESADRYTVKDIENQVAKLTERIKELTEQPGDPDVTFERTGIGYLVVDEAHKYKNRRVISSIDELAHPGNKITEDLAMKLDYLRDSYGRRVVTMATATPIDNSPSEILTMTKYIAPELLRDMGIEEDDQFHATFIQPVRRVEMTPDGSRFQSRSRHALYVNLPEAKRLLFSYADIKTKEELTNLSEPAIVGGKPEILANQAPEELQAHLAELAARAREVAGGQPPLRPNKAGQLVKDNILWISTDGRMASLDLRLVGKHTDEPQKLDVLADRVAEIWRRHKDDVYYRPDGIPEPARGSLQLLFSDLGVPKDGWNFYDAVRDELVRRGMPAAQIRYAQEATNRKQKDQLQRDARDGKVAVLIGSRSKLGTGVNIQKRVVAVFQVDPAWKLSPITQSLGRGQRQGNHNDAIHHIFLVTEGSYDPFLWQKVDTKARFTQQMLDPNDTTRTVELAEDDGSGRLEPAVMFAVGAGRPELLEFAQVEEKVALLELEQKIWHDEQFTLKATVGQNRRRITQLEETVARAEAVLSRSREHGGSFDADLDGHQLTRRPAAGAAIIDHVQQASDRIARGGSHRLTLGSVTGFALHAELHAPIVGPRVAKLALPEVPESELVFDLGDLTVQDPTGLVRQLENRIGNAAAVEKRAREHIAHLRTNIEQAESRLGQPFPRQADLNQHRARLRELQTALDILNEPTPTSDDAAAGGGDNPTEQKTATPTAAKPGTARDGARKRRASSPPSQRASTRSMTPRPRSR